MRKKIIMPVIIYMHDYLYNPYQTKKITILPSNNLYVFLLMIIFKKEDI
jgi:hypothetical protein